MVLNKGAKYQDVWDQSIDWGTQSGLLDKLLSEGQKIVAARVLAGKAAECGVTSEELKLILQEIGVIDAVRVSD